MSALRLASCVIRHRFAERSPRAAIADAERERRGIGDVIAWPEAVNVNALLNDIHKRRRRYIIIHNEHAAVATTLWTAMSWLHNEIATHSPALVDHQRR